MSGPVRWTFYDPTNSTTYTFPINPSEGGSPIHKKTMTYQNTLSPGGRVLIFEGQTEAQEVEFSGTILDQAQYDAMVLWFNKRHQIRLTDDLGRQFNIYITEFTPKRERAYHHPWKHSYSVKYVVMS